MMPLKPSSRAVAHVFLFLALSASTLAACTPPAPLDDLPPDRASATPHVVVAFHTPLPSPTLVPTVILTPALIPPHDLGAGQHIAADGSYSSTETEAAGPMVCQIQRNSPAFQHLTNNNDPRLLWLGGTPESLPDENHLMHAAMVAPLNTLIDLVSQEWAGKTQIMVTAAYDSTGHHDLAQSAQARKYSLHFEGRSIDLITWPPDLAQIARFCALAHQAGFDWVHNEADHCHVSVKTQSLCELYDYHASS